MSFETNLFGNKTMSSVLEDIYKNSKKKEKQIQSLIDELKPLIENIGDATLVVPMIAQYMELGIKNDEALIKMATVAQRMLNAKASGDDAGFELGAEELQQLLENAEALGEEIVKSQENPEQ
jgi:hypothetical protein